MKKTLLAVTLLSVFGVGVANASSVEGPGTGELKIDGAILETNPSWKWQIPVAAMDAARDIKFTRDSGVVEELNTTFTNTDGFIILEGGSIDAASPRPGQFPVITVGGVAIDYGNKQVISLNMTDNSGLVDVSIGSGLAVMYQRADSDGEMSTYNHAKWSSANIATSAKRTMLESSWEPAQGNIGSSWWDMTTVNMHTLLVNPSSVDGHRIMTIIGSAAVEVNEYKLIFPTDAVPPTWSATLPITVSMI